LRLQNFKSRLALTLHDDTSPLDANLESVMPGMHRRMVVMENATRQGDERVKNGFSQMEELIKGGFKNIEQRETQANTKLAEYHLAMATRLGAFSSTKNGGYDMVPPRTTRASSPSNSSPAQQRGINNGGSSLATTSLPTSKHRLTVKHHSLQTLYNEWHGIGEYLDIPVPGGIAALEASHKAKWRNHFSGNEVKTFSRVKIIITGIDAMQYRTQHTIDLVIEELDLVFQKEAKKSVAQMVVIVQNMGLVQKKKARGKTKTAPSNIS
jgi:hypothetical protein